MTELRKWIEHINDAYPMDIRNIYMKAETNMSQR